MTSPQTASNATDSANRRRHVRQLVCVPATVEAAGAVIEGFTDNLSYSGMLVEALTGAPKEGEGCKVTLYLPMGTVEARGRIVRLDRGGRRFAVDLEHLDKNGELLLVAMLVGGEGTLPKDPAQR